MITIKQLHEHLTKMLETDKSVSSLPAVFSIDDEGNAYKYVNFFPSKGMFYPDDYDCDNETENVNSVCIN